MSDFLKDVLYLEYIIQSVESVEQYIGGEEDTLRLLKENNEKYDAILYRLQTLAESIRRLDPQTRYEISTTLPWQEIIDFRNVVVHNYLGIELKVIAGIIDNELPHLKDAITDYLERKNHE
jgi:uncharacterized protein with HEPN domain